MCGDVPLLDGCKKSEDASKVCDIYTSLIHVSLGGLIFVLSPSCDTKSIFSTVPPRVQDILPSTGAYQIFSCLYLSDKCVLNDT